VHRNSKETLTQNYRRLGLISKLNKRAGGVQKSSGTDTQIIQAAEQQFAVRPGTTHTQKPIDEVQLEEDPETGALKVRDDGSKRRANPLNDPLNELEDDTEGPLRFSALGHVVNIGNGAGITESLEEIATSGIVKRPRQQSEREVEWVARLVEKHGDDYGAMFRDRNLNPMQQSVGDIRRRILKWKSKHPPEQIV
jgi:nucleolar protein 16